MKLVIVTGMSGAGKTIALKMLEDLGFYCVDNLPIPLLEPFAQLAVSKPVNQDRVALGIDVRSGEELPQLLHVLEDWKQNGMPYQILFLDASNETLIKRYKETRRSHPLAGRGRVDTGIHQERERLGFLKQEADFIIDTSQLLTRELRQELEKLFIAGGDYSNLFITVLSFGFKYGIPADADLVFDVRFLPNPYYVEELRQHTGEEAMVQAYVRQGGTADRFMEKLCDMLEFLIPNYVLEGKNQLVVAVGCTGGKHRSVTVAGALYQYLSRHEEYGLKIEHRDIDKDRIRKEQG
ncbi:RNase adapter RapZ [Candidatus Ventrimonas sp. KK005]|nr:RNase adapter RapZ [Lachnospiraceae bacterium]NBH16314.1 RNase adapter RapZ [Clostridiaceae bacterium]